MVLLTFLRLLGDFGLFAVGVFRLVFTGRFSQRSLLRQMDRVGVQSLTVVNLCAFFIGMVLVIQIVSLLSRFGA